LLRRCGRHGPERVVAGGPGGVGRGLVSGAGCAGAGYGPVGGVAGVSVVGSGPRSGCARTRAAGARTGAGLIYTRHTGATRFGSNVRTPGVMGRMTAWSRTVLMIACWRWRFRP